MLLRYTGLDINGPVTVRIEARNFPGDATVHEFPGGLPSGTEVSSVAENGFTIDATAHGFSDLGTKTTLFINGVSEVLHTSCSAPFGVDRPAPLDQPKGDPSPNWFVVDFTDK